MSNVTKEKVAVITGANSGIGLALAECLLGWLTALRLCLVCRNEKKALEAKQHLLKINPSASIDLILMDTSKIDSVYDAADELRRKYHHIDFLYLNAGMMSVTSVNWSHFWHQLFSSNCIQMFRTGEGLLKQNDYKTPDGLQGVFATNLFGHFVLVKELQEVMGGSDLRTQVIWTSSSNAKKSLFNVSDIQHERGTEPYSSSKYASDLTSYALNVKLNNQGIYSHTTCPGLVMTNLTYGILPSWFWLLLLPILWLLRLFTATMTVTSRNGAEVLYWLARQDPVGLDPRVKYHSCVSPLGNRYTISTKLDIDDETALQVYDRLMDLEAEFSVMRTKTKSS